MLLHNDVVTDGEPKPSSFSGGLRCEKRVEHLFFVHDGGRPQAAGPGGNGTGRRAERSCNIYSRTFAGRSEKRHENKRKSLWWCGREDSKDLHQERCKYWTSGKRTDVLCTRLLYSLILGFAPISS